MICWQCGAEIPDDVLTCPECDAELGNNPGLGIHKAEQFCPSCGCPLEQEEAICPVCGFAIEEDYPNEEENEA